MRSLELFSGTGSFKKETDKLCWETISLDKFLPADIQEDILTWNYKIYPPKYFDIIWASPVCLYWSRLRNTWIGRKMKSHGDKIITKEILQEDIEKYGKPMVDKLREIIDYFKPQFYFIENPETSRMKEYITDLPYYTVSYCKYEFLYQKHTRIWTNLKTFEPKFCKNDCDSIITQPGETILANGKKVLCNTKKKRDKLRHKKSLYDFGGGTKITPKDIEKVGKGTNRIDRYRVPPLLIQDLLVCCINEDKNL